MTVTLARNKVKGVIYWQARWTENGKHRGKGLGRADRVSEAQARKACQRIEIDLEAGRPVKAPRTPSVASHVEGYLTRQTCGKSHMGGLRRSAGLLAEFFGADRRISTILPSDCKNWAAWLMRGEPVALQAPPSPATFNFHLTNVRAVFADAVDDQVIPSNPFRAVKRAKVSTAKAHKYVPRADIDRLNRHLPNDSFRLLVAFCRLAGLRCNEAVALQVGDLDLGRQIIHVHARLEAEDAKKRKRIAPMTAELIEAIKACPIPNDATAWVLDRDAMHFGANGKPTTKTYRVLQVARENAGLPVYGKILHALRAAFSVDMDKARAMFGITDSEFTDVMGHTPAMARRFYLEWDQAPAVRLGGIRLSGLEGE